MPLLSPRSPWHTLGKQPVQAPPPPMRYFANGTEDEDMALQNAMNLGFQPPEQPVQMYPIGEAADPPPVLDSWESPQMAGMGLSTVNGQATPQPWQQSPIATAEDMARQQAVNNLIPQVQTGAVPYENALQQVTNWYNESEPARVWQTMQAQSAANDLARANYLESVGDQPIRTTPSPPPDNRSMLEKGLDLVLNTKPRLATATGTGVSVNRGPSPNQIADVYNTDIPLYSDFARSTIQPALVVHPRRRVAARQQAGRPVVVAV